MCISTATETPCESGDTTRTTFSIDALGRQASRTVGIAEEITYAYLGTSAQVSSTGTSSTPASYSAIDAIGNRVSVGLSTFGYLVADLHGNVAAAVSSGASPAYLSAYRYDAYGETVDSYTGAGAVDVPYRFQGRILQSAPDSTDLYDFGARSYDPSLGTFTSFDTVSGSAQNPLTLNRYLYALANPATLIDPDGHCAYNANTHQLEDTAGAPCSAQEREDSQRVLSRTPTPAGPLGPQSPPAFIAPYTGRPYCTDLLCSINNFTGDSGDALNNLVGDVGDALHITNDWCDPEKAAVPSACYSLVGQLQDKAGIIAATAAVLAGIAICKVGFQACASTAAMAADKAKGFFWTACVRLGLCDPNKNPFRNLPPGVQERVASAFNPGAQAGTLAYDLPVYRYASQGQPLSNWFTTNGSLTPEQARRLLALPDANKALVTPYIIPKGAEVIQGTAATQVGNPGLAPTLRAAASRST